MPTFKLDDREIPFEPGDTIIRAAQRVGDRHPALLLAPGPQRRGQLPHVPGRDHAAAGPPGDGARRARVGREDGRLRAGQKKPKLQPACQHAGGRGHGGPERHERARRTRARRACRSSCSSTTRSTARSAIRPASAGCRTTGSSTRHDRSACATSRCTSRRPSCSVRPSSTTPSAASCARAACASATRSRRIRCSTCASAAT